MAKQGRNKVAPPDEVAKRIAYLVEAVGGGSQRGLARLAGCSHAVIAKVVKGEQEAGKRLLSQLGNIAEVNAHWLVTGEGEAVVNVSSEAESRVPLFDSLLPHPPAADLTSAVSAYEVIAESQYRESLYVVEASRCAPAFNDPDEQLLPADRILIDADPARWTGNLRSLDGRLCVVRQSDATNIITLQRVWVEYSQKHQSWVLKTCLEKGFAKWLKQKADARKSVATYGRELRYIDLRPEADGKQSDKIFQVISADAVVGCAVKLIRKL